MLSGLAWRRKGYPVWYRLAALLVPVVGIILAVGDALAQEEYELITFRINEYRIEGNTVLGAAEIEAILRPFIGPHKTAEHIEAARELLEAHYLKGGYPTVMVSIPEQTVEHGIVRLEVIERRIRRVRVKGNRYFTKEKILNDLPSLNPGKVLYLPDVQQDMRKANLSSEFKITPFLKPARDPDMIDVELQVEDRLPLHGSIELNNRSSADTTDLRLNAVISYNNLWQKEHSISFQSQTSPQDTREVKVFAVSYSLPTLWDKSQMLAFYAIYSDSDTAFGEGFQTAGKGTILGGRWLSPLPPKDAFYHNISIGLDYKDFDEETAFLESGQERIESPISYVPVSIAYNAALADSWGRTSFSAGANMALRGLGSDSEEFEDKRFKARENYIYLTLGIERHQDLPSGFGLYVKLDGQISDDPLISNEQYLAGGMDSVRGYYEAEQAGDQAFHSTVEVQGPDLAEALLKERRLSWRPHVFFDYAKLFVNDALPSQEDEISMKAIGVGFRGSALDFFDYGLDWGHALAETSQTDSGDQRATFFIKYRF